MSNELSRRFADCEFAACSESPAGFEKITLRNNRGHELDIYPYGATITSWRLSPHDDVLFLSSKVEYKKGKAIRGGIPLVFPQFGPGILPSHGFARVMDWQVQSLNSSADGSVELTLGLPIAAPVSDAWPHALELRYIVTLGSSLKTALHVTNKASTEIRFQEAFHSYFRISDISQVELPGFSGLTYLDNLKARAPGIETRAVISISEEIDRVYVGAPNRIEIRDNAAQRTIEIESQALRDAVLWNPWIEKSRSLADLGPQDFKRFVCVETGNISEAVVLAPGKTHCATQEIRCR